MFVIFICNFKSFIVIYTINYDKILKERMASEKENKVRGRGNNIVCMENVGL